MIASLCCRMVIVIVVGVLRKRRENTIDKITIRSSFESDWLRRWRGFLDQSHGEFKQNHNNHRFEECNSKDCLSIKTRYSNIFAGSGFRG